MAQSNHQNFCLAGADSGDTAWMIVASVLVLGMMPGLSLFEAGLLRTKNTISILIQVMSGIAILSMLWMIVGFSLVFGRDIGGVIGNPGHCIVFAPSIPGNIFALFQAMFASITPLLMTGAFAGRMRFKAYIVFITLWELIVYYPLAHSIWGGGWLSPVGNRVFPQHEGVLDFAGGVVIHTTAGVGALVSAIYLGRRKGFEENNFGKFPMSNVPLALVGACFLWIGWFGFNAGSSFQASSLTAVAVINTQMAATVSGVCWLFLSWIHHAPSMVECVNGVIGGLAGITPASGYVASYSAFGIGIVLGVASFYGVIVLKLRIDDALDVSVVHGLTGVIGSLAIGFLADVRFNHIDGLNGWIAGNPAQIGYQFLGVGIALCWGGLWTYILLKFVDVVIGVRVTDTEQDIGLDLVDHHEKAYGDVLNDYESINSH